MMATLTSLLLAPLLTLSWVPLGEGGKFWHVTDIHLDTLYSTGGDRANWCRNSSQIKSKAVDSGDYQCDSPLLLVKSAVRAMSRFEPDPEFILWTGDSNPHWKKDQNGNDGPDYPYIWNNLKTIHKILASHFPNATIVPVLGNHDSFPADSFPSYENSSDATNIYTNYLTKGALGDFIMGSSRDTFKKCGYYKRDLVTSKNTNIKLLNLNTNIYYNNPLASGADPCGQLDWLEKELNNAKAADHVYITAHVPPGSNERNPDKSFFNTPIDTALHIQRRFVEILRTPKHAEKIVAHFYGHIHTDTFRLFLDSARGDEARGVGFMASSVTPILWDGRDASEKLPMASVGTNPGVRLFEFDDGDASLLDYIQYGLDLDSLVFGEVTEDKPKVKSRNRNSKGPLINEKAKKKRQAEIEASAVSPVVNSGMNNVAQAQNVTEGSETSMTPVPAVPGMEVESNYVEDGVNSDIDKTTANVSSVNEPRTADITESSVTVEAVVSEPQPIDSTNDSVTTGDDVISDEDQRVIDLSDKWKAFYNATASFGVKSLSKKEMMLAYKAMVKSPKSEVFKRYYKHNTNNHIVDDGKCSLKCHREHLCTISNFLTDIIKHCLKSNDTFYLFYTEPKPTQPPTSPQKPDNPTPSRKVSIPTSTSRGLLKIADQVVVDDYESSHSYNHEDNGSVSREPIKDTGSYGGVKGLGIFLAVAAVVILMIIVLVAIRKFRANRYRNQEFLLTDSVFRYDGYNQLDDA